MELRGFERSLIRRLFGGAREFFIDNLLVRIHFIIVMIRWTGLVSWKFEFPFPGSLKSDFLGRGEVIITSEHVRYNWANITHVHLWLQR